MDTSDKINNIFPRYRSDDFTARFPVRSGNIISPSNISNSEIGISPIVRSIASHKNVSQVSKGNQIIKTQTNNQNENFQKSNGFNVKNRSLKSDLLKKYPIETHSHYKANKLNPRFVYTPVNFWFEDPSSLFQNFDIIPHIDMTEAERFNSMTRVIIIISAVMFALKFPFWWLFLTLGLIVVIILWYIIRVRENEYSNHIREQSFSREYLRKPIYPAGIGTIIQPVNNILRPYSHIQPNVNNQQLKIISIP
jgi:hypothetical protein